MLSGGHCIRQKGFFCFLMNDHSAVTLDIKNICNQNNLAVKILLIN